HVTGAQTSSLMGGLSVSMGSFSVFKVEGNPMGTDTRGTGTVTFGTGPLVSMSAVQFTPGAGHILWPKDGGFTTTLNFGTQFASGTVNLNRAQGAPVTIGAGSFFDIEFGIVNAGNTGDPFTDTSTFVHLPVTNNATFNITAGSKHVASIGGGGATSVSAGAR